MVEAWIEVSRMYKCVRCGEYFVSLFVSYGEPSTFEYPLVCKYHWKENLKSAVKMILNADVDAEEKIKLIARLLDFIEAR